MSHYGLHEKKKRYNDAHYIHTLNGSLSCTAAAPLFATFLAQAFDSSGGRRFGAAPGLGFGSRLGSGALAAVPIAGSVRGSTASPGAGLTMFIVVNYHASVFSLDLFCFWAV